MEKKYEQTIEMPDQYIKHVEGVKTMTPDELSDKNITKEKNFEMPPSMTGEGQDFTEEMIDEKQPEVLVKEEKFDFPDKTKEDPTLYFKSPSDVINYIEETNNIKINTGYTDSAKLAYQSGTMTLEKMYSYLLNKAGLSEDSKNVSRLAMQLYRETENLVNEYKRTKNTSLEDKLQESITKTNERLKQVKDKDMSIYFANLDIWKELLPNKLKEKS